jgi:putative RNA 2'-phosphotransferase
MAAHYMPKTLAKTLTYILCHAPGEYGLFWNPDGTMPWKELYWALQEDSSLRFVRESHLRELAYLGIDLPFSLEDTILRLKNQAEGSAYSSEPAPPQKLYYACRRKHYPFVLEHGIHASSRPFLPLSSGKELALRLGRRRDPDPILIEVSADKAIADGIIFRKAGPELYLVDSLSRDCLVFPKTREEVLLKVTNKQRKEKKSSKPATAQTPGSYLMDPQHLQELFPDKSAQGRNKGRRGAEWKRESRKDRTKREV